jgi:Na+-transporting NADH:ubiquinone oxidoreductase subunit NqrB
MAQCLITQAQGQLYIFTIGRVIPCCNIYHWFIFFKTAIAEGVLILSLYFRPLKLLRKLIYL